MTRQNVLRRGGISLVALAVAYVALKYVLPANLHVSGTETGMWQTPPAIVFKGLIVGSSYGLLGVGLVLIYRSNRIINFAHGDIGAFGAVIFLLLQRDAHIPYWIAMIPALLIAGLIGALAETAVIRRLRKAPLVMSVVATLGVGQFLVLLAAVIDSQAGHGNNYPQPAGLPSFKVGQFFVTPAFSALLIFSPLVVAAIALFLRYSRYGIALRCAADNPDASRMAGIFAGRMSTLAWALGGAVAALTAIFTAPTVTLQSLNAFGPSLLEVALAAAVIGRMESLPITLAAGGAIGVIQSLLIWNYTKAGAYSAILFVLIVGALLLQRQRTGRAEAKGSWAAVQAIPPIPPALREVWAIRNLGRGFGLLALALLLLLPGHITAASAVKITTIFALVIVGLSAGIVTGLAGQLSLGQFAIGGVGALASYEIASRTGDYYLSFLYAGLAAAVVSVLIGLPSLRVKGLLLTVTTLSFALVVPNWLLRQPWTFGSQVTPGSPTILGQHLTTSKHYYYFALTMALLSLLIAGNVRRSGIGRLFLAVRDNEDNARAFTIPAAIVKIQGFAVGGFLAGIGGALYAHSLSTVNNDSFSSDISIAVLVMAVIGGLGTLYGPILGALLVFALPEFVNLGALGLAGTSLGQLFIILYLPGGLGQLIIPVRDRLVRFVGVRFKVDVAAAYLAESSSGAAVRDAGTSREMPSSARPVGVASQRQGPILEATGLVRSFGGVRAVRDVSLAVQRGEILGLIGPNGAGKTTTFELLAGFTKPDQGSVLLNGEDVTDLSPEARGQRGLIRSFQDAALFPTLSVLECVQLSLERNDATRFMPQLLGFTGQEKRKEALARELVSWMGLDRYRSAQVQSLSTGTRRITEIACLVAMTPKILLLDEPCSGVAQRETEALSQLLQQLKVDLDLTLMIIEHDIPMIMSMSDRIICMADGEIIAQGSPDVVRNDPKVVESYLGGSLTAIERSDSRPGKPGPEATTASRKPALASSSS
ncbi:MAG: putative transporter ATPase and permease protein [Frankiales bacterium]|nr:putative transporter ATPase and permease protein [Frankiales bacterium]